MALRIAQWILSNDEIRNIKSCTVSLKQMNEIIAGEIMTEDLENVFDMAQGEVATQDVKRSFILICIE